MPTRIVWRSAILTATLAMVLAGCTAESPNNDSARLHQEAQADLAHWDDALAAATQPDFVPVDDLTGFDGDWGDQIDPGNAKLALGAGLFQATIELPESTPPDASVAWPGGTTESFHLISAAQAFADLKSDGIPDYCPNCTPLQVTAAALTTAQMRTTRGTVDAPVWRFTISDSSAIIWRLAVAGPVVVKRPTFGEGQSPVGISIQEAKGIPSDSQLVAVFMGAAAPGQGSCPATYTTEAVESDAAVVVLVYEHSGLNLGACDDVGYWRDATVQLAGPLGTRAVLSVGMGSPVVLLPPGSPDWPTLDPSQSAANKQPALKRFSR